MAAVSLRLPDSIYRFAKELSQKDHVSFEPVYRDCSSREGLCLKY